MAYLYADLIAFMQANRTSVHRSLAAITAAVVLLHVGGLAALQSKFFVRANEQVMPIQMVAQIIEPTQPVVPTLLPTPAPIEQKKNKAAPRPTPAAQSAPTPNTQPPAPTAAPNTLPNKAPDSALVTAPLTSQVISSLNSWSAPAPAAAVAPVTESGVSESTSRSAASAPGKSTAPISSSIGVSPEIVYQSPPQIHRMSLAREEYGSARLRLLISADGTPLKAEVAQSSGFALLDRAFINAALQNKYKPATCDGRPVKIWAIAPYFYLPAGQSPEKGAAPGGTDCRQLPPQE